MEYKYAPKENYEDFACGRVIYHVGGEPTFPVRLTLELFERCLQYSNKKSDLTVYDCCCGGAYMLTILGLLKGSSIASLYGSDVDPQSLTLAKDNLGLLSKEGIEKRRRELVELYYAYGKASHQEALQSIDRIEALITKEIKTCIFHQNVFEINDIPFTPDIIITDVPYGNMAEWSEGSGGVNQMLNALSKVCERDTILCICMDKKQKIHTEKFERLERQQIGKRKFEIYKVIN